ncbi:hypothetical protein EDB86DRAFT_3088650 [Lactarius hatsudake]|nr:hypothetical protein EDB86DRAFT_3088650 [Lactarius hatsudake]
MDPVKAVRDRSPTVANQSLTALTGSTFADTRDPRELIPSSPSWAVDTYPIGTICHKTYLYHNERVGRPYGYIFILDHPTWTSIRPIEDPPVGIPQLDDIHGFIALDGSLVPHPAEYPDTPTNRLWYKSYRIATTNEA